MNTSIFRVKKLDFERNNTFLFKQFNMELEPRQLLQIFGANGSGKSTLLRILASFIEPQHGTITWQNKCIYADRHGYLKQLRYIGHKNGLKDNLTVYENLQTYCALISYTPTSHELKKIMQQIGLEQVKNSPIMHLSAGQGRRLSLAKLLLDPVAIWILDEPMTALDKDGLALLSSLLNQHLINQGIAMVATHHNLSSVTNSQKIYLGMTQ